MRALVSWAKDESLYINLVPDANSSGDAMILDMAVKNKRPEKVRLVINHKAYDYVPVGGGQ
jgi:hypothetical protein